VAVFGTDDRIATPTRFRQLAQQIGLFFSNPAKTVCTAFCVAPNIVATAAHCLAQPGGKAARLSDFMFARGYDRLREFARIEGHANGSAAQSVLSGDFQHRVKPPIDAANDWALVRLDRNACPGNGLPVVSMPGDEILAAGRSGRIFQLSYHRDWAQWRLAYSQPCRTGRDFEAASWSAIAPDFISAEQMILHHCDTGGASSGSPLLVETKTGVAVVAINVGTYVQSKTPIDKSRAEHVEITETVANTAVSAAVFLEHIERLRSAALLATGQPIRELQERLAARRLYDSRIDGSYGPMLRGAIERYERESRLPVTGLATRDLLERLNHQATSAGRVAPTSAPASGTPTRPPQRP
jgi:hypothetical protein